MSKRRDRPYQAGRSKHWVKVNNPAAPAKGDGRVVGQNQARRRAGRVIDLLAYGSLFFQL